MTDEEYLWDYIQQHNRGDVEGAIADASAEYLADRYVASGILNTSGRDRTIADIRSIQSVYGLCVEFPKQIKKRTLVIIEEHRSRLESVPVGLLAQYSLNGQVRKSPSGGEIVLLNFGIVTHLGSLVKLATGLISYDFFKEVCGVYSREDFAASIALLAGDLIFPGRGWLSEMPLLGYLMNADLTLLRDAYLQKAQEFILLHEYGHIVCGHMENRPFQEYGPEGDNDIEPTRAHEMEFEADEFAMRALFANQGDESSRVQVAYVTGLFYRFADLRDALALREKGEDPRRSKSHPPMADRWIKVRRLIDSDQSALMVATLVDNAFDAILASLSLGPLTSRAMY